MGNVTTYFAIMKGYTTLNIFTLPIGFKFGGWLFSPIILIFVCFFETTMAIRLSWVAHHVKIYHYPDLVEYAFGKRVRFFFQIVVACLHFSFSFTMLAFFPLTLMRLTKSIFGVNASVWWFMLFAILFLAPVVWIRTIESLRYGYIYCAIVIIAMIGIVVYFDVM